jgi:hypothetical protein
VIADLDLEVDALEDLEGRGIRKRHRARDLLETQERHQPPNPFFAA